MFIYTVCCSTVVFVVVVVVVVVVAPLHKGARWSLVKDWGWRGELVPEQQQQQQQRVCPWSSRPLAL